MKYNPQIHHRRSIRLKGYDYSQAGLYFITICCYDRLCLFGNVTVGAENFPPEMKLNNVGKTENFSPEMKLNDAGKIADDCWLEISKHFPNVILHKHIIMPNHVHGIIQIIDTEIFPRETQTAQSPENTNEYSPKIVNEYSPENANEYFNMVEKNIVGDNGAKNTNNGNGAKNISPLRISPSKTVGSIVRGFKIGVTKWMRQNTIIYNVWQRNYYEHIIRDE